MSTVALEKKKHISKVGARTSRKKPTAESAEFFPRDFDMQRSAAEGNSALSRR
jgi:hypothetical protein